MSSTLLPFLYKTRTLQHALRRPLLTRALHASHPYAHPRGPPRNNNHGGPPRNNNHNDDDVVPFDFGPDQRGLAATRRRRTPGSTMTESEQRVFDDIFGAISRRRKQLGGGAIRLGVEPPPREGLPDPADEGKDEQELRRERILSMYPPTLRHAAETALGLQAEEDEPPPKAPAPVVSEGPYDPASTEVEKSDAEILKEMEGTRAARRAKAALLAFHKAERTRFQSTLQDCASDAAVWDILEAEVFSMPQRLGIGGKKPAPKRKAGKTAPPATPLTMDRYGPLYSVYLLAAVRHLDRGFATPSPLALAVLPRVLELGMASYVLGVSTRFYNELLSICWYRYSDVRSVVRVLRDMERSGLAPDRQTLKILEAARGAVEGLAEAEGNPLAEVLGSMKDYDTVALEQLEGHKRRAITSLEQQTGALPF